MNLFAQQIKFEDTEGLEYPEGQLITEGDEGESVAAAVAEVTEEEAGIAEDERAMDGLVEDEETLSEVQEVVENDAPKMEHTGLTPVGARLAKIVLARVVGKRHADKTLPKMEHFNSRSDARDATSFVQEGVADALKSFWEALKAQFKKIWAKVKTWAIKTFSAAQKIHDRAKAIRDRAESSSSTIDKKSFQFAQAKQLVVDGRLKEVSKFENAFGYLVNIVKATTNVQTDKSIEKLADALDTVADAKDADLDVKVAAIANPAIEALDRVANNAVKDIVDPKVLSSLGGGDGGDAEVTGSETLPGDKILVVITAKNETDYLKTLRMTRVSFANTKNKPREIGNDVEVTTLNPSQIAKLCDGIIDTAGDIVEFESKWQKTDKAQETVLRKLDEVIRDAIQDDKDSDNENSKEREIRTLASAATNFIKRVGGIQAQVASFALPVYAATLNWCEGSMRNYKK